MSAAEFDAIAAEAEAPGGGGEGEGLEGDGAAHNGVVAGLGLEKLMAGDVHDKEVILDHADAVGADGELVAGEVEGDFGEEIALVFLLDAAGVAGAVDEDGEGEAAVREADAGGVAKLGGGGLSGEEDGAGEELLGLGGVEGGGGVRLGGGRLGRGEER